ncbi:hypothetical protein GS891_12020 [Rhodococcus hoagii]|nr:hypothetical protein [Prescottella equi]
MGDIVLSLPVSARTTALLRRSAGSVSNVVPLRVRVDPSDTVADLVRRVQIEMTGALRHQRFRYEDMLRELPERRGTHGARRSVRARREHPAVPADGRVRPGHRRTVRPVDRAGRGPVADGLPGWRG